MYPTQSNFSFVALWEGGSDGIIYSMVVICNTLAQDLDYGYPARRSGRKQHTIAYSPDSAGAAVIKAKSAGLQWTRSVRAT